MSTAEQWTVDSVRAALGAKKVSARELTTEYYARIEKQNPELNAFLALCPERAYAQAERIDGKIARGEPLPPLAGVPMAIKDVISTRGVTTTCGSRILENYIPPYDAWAVECLNAPAQSCSARPTATSLQWALPTRTRRMGRFATQSLATACRVGQAEARPQP